MDRILKILKKENDPRASSATALELDTHNYTPGIYADRYIVFAFPFVRSYVR